MTDHPQLPAELTIYAVGELHARLCAWARPEPGATASLDVHVDASAVTEVDAAGVQLLQSGANTLAQQDRRLVLDCPSAALVAACDALGLGQLLGGSVAQGEPA